ncbi:MAG: deoxyhypusine synthase family protein, partial [Candidatus Thermoplasmatota archaeon]
MKKINPIFSPYGYAFNSARLAEACGIYEKMIEEDATICFTLAGAIIPAGLGGAIIEMVKLGLVDFIISTGANLYHDIHFALDLPVYKGNFNVDDRELAKNGIVRIYDIFIPIETLFETDKYIQENFDIEGNFSTAEIHNYLGKKLLENSKKPESSLLATCAKYDVPIYCPSPGDSSIGMNLSYLRLKNKKIHSDVEKDVLDTTAIIYNSKKSGAVI